MSGYSSTPLWKKLGYANGTVAALDSAPDGYLKSLGLPADFSVQWSARVTARTTFVHLFVTELETLKTRLHSLRHRVAPACAIWVSWPKKSSNVKSEVTENLVRDVALPLGLVDIKVCAVDETWSGLKLVIRKELRG